MYKVHLFKYKSEFNTVFNVNPGNQSSPITFFSSTSSIQGWASQLSIPEVPGFLPVDKAAGEIMNSTKHRGIAGREMNW
jgi:hypothetical protein